MEMMSSGAEKKDFALLKLDIEAISHETTKCVCVCVRAC